MDKTRNKDDNCLTFDELLPTIGDFGFYQKRLVFYVAPFFFLWAFTYLTQIFLILVPEEHWCQIPELKDLSQEAQKKLAIPKIGKNEYDKCNMYDTNFTKALEENLTVADESWPTKPCDDWNYDTNEVPYSTVATEYNWVCHNDHLGAWTVTIYFLGSCIGCLVFGYISDHLGRLPAVMLSNLCCLIGGSLTAFCTSFMWFSLARFVIGLGFDNCCMPMYILLIEYVAPEYRAPLTNIVLTMFYFPGSCALPWIALACNGWRILALATALSVLICFFVWPLMHESARWLISVGKTHKAMSIIRSVAKTNGKSVPEEVLLEFEKCSIAAYQQNQSQQQHTLLDLFKSLRICLITLNLIIIWMITDVVYDAHVRAIIDIGPDIFITFSVANAVEAPACLVPLFLLDIIGRKLMSILVFIGCALGSIMAAWLKATWQTAVSALFGRFCAAIAYNIGVQWSNEILPTVVRGQGGAFIHLMGFVASLLSPFVVYTKHYSPSAPMSIIGILAIVAALLVLFLPETTNIELPETPKDTENLSKSQKMFSFRTNISART